MSNTEEKRVENAINMIKDALKTSDDMRYLQYEVFAQGSYANNTNVRIDSDIDICVMLCSTIFTEYPDGLGRNDYGFTEGSIDIDTYKMYVLHALEDKFGISNVSVGNKSIKISSNTYHVQADVIPAFMLKDFKVIDSRNPERYIEGIRYIASDGSTVTNYPKEHIQNGKNKNKRTNYEYKKLVRIMKHIRNNMVDSGLVDGDVVSSFLIECLVWNASDFTITNFTTWNETIKSFLASLSIAIENDNHREWGEVSERLYLFHSGRKWTAADVKDFTDKAWIYLGY